jgi:pSer/pThr/pTyr-binding forkhead associated (FHA) protein
MRALRLVITEGGETGREFQVSGSLAIGRDASAGIVIDDDETSRRHAVVTRDGDELVILDLDSTNGTWVNDERIASGHRVRLGDRVRIGATVLELRDGEISVPG